MREHLSEPIAIPDVAEAAGLSVRGLQLVFQRRFATTPLMHLRQMRLEAARQSLLEHADEGTTVAETARRFGYTNSGRFATHYRNEFGEAPGAALQRIRDGRRDRDAGERLSESAVAHSR
jgi:transcriptional regulator GlxA family with amidase domain